MAREEAGQFRMKDLFIDVKLEACVNGSTFDFLGRKLFSTEFYRQNIGFGITDIDIEINTSLQPLVTVTFKDLYGNTVFGSQGREAADDGQSIDYSVLFNWPPPKFLFSFKGYLGKPASWVLNLKKTTTSFNSSDGSYDLKCEFVPNQWGFFADMPFLYLLAAKRLRKDKLGNDVTQDQLRGITSVFDLIKIGKQVEVKTQDTTKEFDDLVKQLGSIKSNMARALVVTNILAEDEVINGAANNQSTKNFVKMTIPSFTTIRDKKNLGSPELIDQHLSAPQSLNALNAYFLLSIKFDSGGKNQDGFDRFGGMPTDFKKFRDAFNTGGSDENLAISTAKSQTLGLVSDNLEKVDDEIKRRVFSTSRTKLEKITIGNIFSQLAKDAAFVIGSILDAGLDGYLGDPTRRENRDRMVRDGDLIGESFPLVILEGEELPATEKNAPNQALGVDEHEMDFVKRFINAISEGIAKDLLSGNEQNGQDDAILKQRINNMEMASENPYKSYYQNIAQNILIRGGIAAFFTRSDDPNLPGDYDTTFGGDRDDLQSVEEIAERDMQNVTDGIIKNLSDVDFLLLRRFCTFMSRFFTKDAEGIATASGEKGIDLSFGDGFVGAITSYLTAGISDLLTQTFKGDQVPGVLDWKVVMSSPTPANLGVDSGDNNPLDFINFANNTQFAQAEALGVQTLNFQTIWNELYTPALLKDVEILGDGLVFSEIEDVESGRADQDISNQSVTGTTGGEVSNFNADFAPNKVRNAQTPLSFVNTTDFTATRIVNNGIAYAFPNSNFTQNDYFFTFFRGEENKRAQEANTAPTDSEFKNEDKDDTGTAGQTEVLGYVPVNSKYDDDDDELGRITTLKDYRDGTLTSVGGNVFDFDQCKDPSPGFFGITGSPFGLADLLWTGAILEDQNDNDDLSKSINGTDYVGNVGYTVCAHSGSDDDSGFMFGLFNPSRSGRNHRAYVRKCAEVLLRQIDEILDERNQIIGEVLGKAGESEDLIYKQMHTLFHQWQTLSYSDKKDSSGSLCGNVEENKGGDGGDNGKVFNNAEALESRFGGNHHNLAIDEKICFPESQLIEESDFTAEQLAEFEDDGKGNLCLSLSNQSESSGVPDGTFIYDYPLQRISRPPGSNVVNVKDSIINLEPLYNPNGNTTVLNIIQQVCSKNNFLFIPIPGNPGYLDVKEIYTPSREPANIAIRNFFHVLFTPTPESRTKTRNNEGTPLSLSENHRTYNANSFVIRYGHPDNQIVSNIQVGTDENKVTAESIINLQRLVDNENQNKKVTTDCSMLPVLAGRSYKASVDMIGNSQCYPMQFFYLENSPLFGGLYQIMKVKHSITPNDMKTSLEGIRMRFAGGNYGGIEPITLQTFIDLGESEAPFALGQGFDKSDRENLSNFRTSIPSPGSVSRTANVSDYSGQAFVDGRHGGPVAQAVPTLSVSQLNAFDTSLGVRDLWAGGVKTGSAQMYIVDAYPMKSDVASAYIAMRDAAIADGVNLKITSGYRDPFNNIVTSSGKHISTSQLNLRIQNVIDKSKKGDDNFLRTASSSNFKPKTAPPGRSNHNSGIAIDLNCYGAALRSPFNQEIYEWLMLNAHRFGFVRTVSSEEWHWEYRPGKAMFQFVARDKKLWYGLPDKLGIPETNAEIDEAANAPTTVPATTSS